jgi:hypothetical protein
MACRALACLDLAWLVRSFFGLWDWFVTDSATTPHSGQACADPFLTKHTPLMRMR